MPLIIPTCETAVSTLPEWHRAAFKGLEELVTSASGWSPGALNLAQGVAMKLHAPLLHNEMTQLLIDLSCDPTDPARWSAQAMALTEDQREKLDQRQKTVYLGALNTRITTAVHRGEIPVHLSFDTRMDLRGAWIVIEYDLRRGAEADLAKKWKAALLGILPDAVIREEASPTKGLGAYLRARHPTLLSLRITVEQATFLEGKPVAWAIMKKAVIASVATL